MKRKTQEQIVLQHLKKYNRITSMDAFRKYSITRLSGRIFNLRAVGIDIITDRETKNGSTYAVYRLRPVKGDTKCK